MSIAVRDIVRMALVCAEQPGMLGTDKGAVRRSITAVRHLANRAI